jgi:predicted ATP-dependent endonuclease of OLD family
MRLLGAEIRGFRRFLRADIDFDADPVSIIGRNEAGKSSLLDALTRLNDPDAIERHDQTRGHSFDPDDRILRVWFALDVDDKALLSGIPEAAGASRYIITKAANGTIRGRFDPNVARDLRPRQRASQLHARVGNTKWYGDSEFTDSDEYSDVGTLLGSDRESLTPDEIATIRSLAEQLPTEPGQSLPAVLRARLEELAQGESHSTPANTAAGILLPRRPQFVLFSQEHRDLQTVYDLTLAAPAPPPALANIAALAGLSLDECLAAHLEENYGRVAKLQRDANDRLQQFFSTAWRQSAMHVQLRIDKNELRVLVDNLQGDLTSIGERSAGLQTFVALVAFLASKEHQHPPVILVDEAETHLHYDAQADLIRVLSEQDAVAKVIYTTHSAGCLPLDLGLGVRAIVAEAGDLSRIENSVWELGPGLSPMLLAMGASVLAFSRARRAVVGEGASEAQLLPSLLREAVPPAEVDYQVAPGVANASEEAIADLELEAVSIAYVLDGDKGGRDHAKRLRATGIPEARILFLGGSSTSGVTLEDLVARDAYHRAVNDVFATWRPGTIFPLSAVPVKGRAAALAKWTRQRGFRAPDKKRVAARLLSQRGNPHEFDTPARWLTTEASRRILRRLHANVLTVLATKGREEQDSPR